MDPVSVTISMEMVDKETLDRYYAVKLRQHQGSHDLTTKVDLLIELLSLLGCEETVRSYRRLTGD